MNCDICKTEGRGRKHDTRTDLNITNGSVFICRWIYYFYIACGHIDGHCRTKTDLWWFYGCVYCFFLRYLFILCCTVFIDPVENYLIGQWQQLGSAFSCSLSNGAFPIRIIMHSPIQLIHFSRLYFWRRLCITFINVQNLVSDKNIFRRFFFIYSEVLRAWKVLH